VVKIEGMPFMCSSFTISLFSKENFSAMVLI
jgi:hypothetical protein